MKAGAYLRQYKDAKSDIQRRKSQIEMQRMLDAERLMVLRNSIILPSKATDGMPHAPTYDKDRIPTVLAKEDEIIKRSIRRTDRLLAEIDKLEALMESIEESIDKVDNPTYRSLLHWKYIECRTWRSISDDLGLEQAYVRKRLRDKAFKALEKWI